MEKCRIKRLLKVALLVSSCCVATLLASPANAAGRGFTMLPGNVKNFELPNFNEKSGWKEWELFGDSANYVNDTRVDVSKILLKLFEGENALKATIKSDACKLNPTTKIADSPEKIFVNGDGFSLEGRGWVWRGEDKRTEILNDVVAKFSDSGMSEIGKKEFAPQKSAETKDAKDAGKENVAKDAKETSVESVRGVISYGGENNVFLFADKVRVRGDDMFVDCDALRINASKGGEAKKSEGAIREIEASGNVDMRREAFEAKAGKSLIYPSKDFVVFSESPTLADSKSGAALAGNKIEIRKGDGKIVSYSAPHERAIAVFKHSPKAGDAPQTITVIADKIEMTGGEKTNEFDFSGKVKIVAPDFWASCKKLKALAAVSGSGDREIVSILGEGMVRFSNESGDTRSDFISVKPKSDEVELFKNASLSDKKSGMKVDAEKIVFERAKDRGRALAAKGGVVITTIPETASAEALAEFDGDVSASAKTASRGSKKSAKKASGATVVRSKSIDFSRDGKKLTVLFKDNVSVKNSTADVLCDTLEVFAVGDEERGTSVRKITARGDVRMKNEGYSSSSRIAEIYPKVGVNGGEGKSRELRRYVELSTPEGESYRPRVMLPPMGNIGLSSSDEVKTDGKTPTVITSDKQYLSSSGDGVDRYFFEGNVEVRGSDLKADCERIEVILKSPKPRAKRRITQIAMFGNVKMDQGTKHAECDRADIFTEAQMAVLRGDAFVFNREDNTRVSGPRLTYNAGTHKVSMEYSEDDARSSDTQAVRPKIILPSFGTAKSIKEAKDAKKAESASSVEVKKGADSSVNKTTSNSQPAQNAESVATGATAKNVSTGATSSEKQVSPRRGRVFVGR